MFIGFNCKSLLNSFELCHISKEEPKYHQVLTGFVQGSKNLSEINQDAETLNTVLLKSLVQRLFTIYLNKLQNCAKLFH